MITYNFINTSSMDIIFKKVFTYYYLQNLGLHNSWKLERK